MSMRPDRFLFGPDYVRTRSGGFVYSPAGRLRRLHCAAHWRVRLAMDTWRHLRSRWKLAVVALVLLTSLDGLLSGVAVALGLSEPRVLPAALGYLFSALYMLGAATRLLRSFLSDNESQNWRTRS